MTIDWQTFTPWSSLFGGVIIGLAAGALALRAGRILGVSGIVAGLAEPDADRLGRAALVAGLILSPVLFGLVAPLPALRIDAGWAAVIAGGLLVGFGTRLGSGCTSGHGVCGLARLSPRSLVAVVTFVVAAMATVFVLRHAI
ncbi:YeeE/YedE family protein [Siculibacillus lacustris]|uniref:YeeE/YedE family protein n=1 Tax=Siculibacillus lacustris TaxID=1549641 RepID=A0A4Q9VJI9_9HYPH|nr:YeeE/YedE thiosulfate transporter family protein [Siculibacillus lacustris]TBW35505.1 YeeE/YedE family protein [Siculibacillus lacustris]